MKKASDALLAHLASGTPTIAVCLLIVRQDFTSFAYTSLDQDIIFDIQADRLALGIVLPDWLQVGPALYQANPGIQGQDRAAGSAMATDTTNVLGPMNPTLTDNAITAEDVQAGKFDSSRWAAFIVNYMDLTMGAMALGSGPLGRITTGASRDQFSAELNGMLQTLQANWGRVLTAACVWTLGDTRCRVDLTTFTKTGTIEGINDDFLTFYDSARTEDSGVIGTVNVTNVTNANPGQVTVDDASGLFNELAIVIAGVVGPSLINNITTVSGLSGNTFNLPIDTSDTSVYPTYVSGGTVTPLGVASGYFDGGILTWNVCADTRLNGARMDVKLSAPGQWTLQQKMEFQPSIGDTYTIVAGCDKTMVTCAVKFGNSDRHGGFPYVIGIDLLAQATNQA